MHMVCKMATISPTNKGFITGCGNTMHRERGSVPVGCKLLRLKMTRTVVVRHVARLTRRGVRRSHPTAGPHPQIAQALGRFRDGRQFDMHNGQSLDALRIENPKLHASQSQCKSDIQPTGAVPGNGLE